MRNRGSIRGLAARAAGLSCAAFLAAAACAGGGGANTCKISVLNVEKFDVRPGAATLAYKVKGDAGGPAVVSLVAKLGPGNFINGKGVEVGPGPFLAVVDLKLTGTPPELLVLLDLGTKRCSAKARLPS